MDVWTHFRRTIVLFRLGTYFETLQAADGQLCRCLHYIRGTQWLRQSTLKRCRPTYFETLQAPDGQLCRCLHYIRGTQWMCQSTLKRCRPTYFETLQAPDGQLCRCLTFYIFYTRLIYLVHGAQRATLRLVTACHLGIYLYTEYMVAW